ncbi:ornithine decarboxylase isoform X2 [Rhipicephalus microplus]|uniref:ornithine decarboxylase isoform X2 n=1 Tax=Rhipicephalus microplus TaxID=6941 RepID=UPI003F6ADC85
MEMRKSERGIPLLFVDEDVEDVASKVIERKIYEDEAFFLCDIRNIKHSVSLWQQELPEIQPYYCVRCCSNSVILRTLSSSGVNFACGSKHEIQTLLEMGVKENRILYESTTKCPSHLKYAEKCGVRLMCSDSAVDMERIRDDKARFDMGVISLTDDAFSLTVRNARSVFDLGQQMGFSMTVLNIGGGFAITSQKNEGFLQVSRLIKSALNEHFSSSSELTVIAEPGPFLVASAFTLATKVVAKKSKVTALKAGCQRYDEVFINESKYNSIPRDASEEKGISIRPLAEYNDRNRDVWTTFWAATSNPRDLIFDRLLFWPVHVNEWLLIDNVGAYSTVLACSFNGSGMPPVMYITSADDAENVSKGTAATAICSGYSQLERAVK